MTTSFNIIGVYIVGFVANILTGLRKSDKVSEWVSMRQKGTEGEPQ